jgi:glycosyltransferase involved in cell wall biosynthesis
MPDVARWVDPLGTPVRIFGGRTNPPLRDYLFSLGVAWTFLRERRNYQLVYFLMQGLHLAVGLPVARFLSKPIVMKISGSNLIPLMQRSFLGRFELRSLKRWARRVMILNPGMVEEATSAGLPQDLLLWMPNPVDISQFAPCEAEPKKVLRQQAGVAPDAQVVIFVGRFAPEKQLGSLLDAFRIVVDRFPDALLVLAGDGPEKQALEAHVQRNGLGRNLRFPGRLQEKEVGDWLRLADVFTLTSSQEGFPVSLVEAMATELPSVVSDIPANTQLIEPDIHGLLAPVGDASAIAAGLSRLLGDEALRARMGKEARRRVVDNYSTDKVIDRYEALFAEALASAL